jgi:hypothetical protein
MMVPFHSRAALMARMEDSSFRQVERITTLLIKLQASSVQRASETLAITVQEPILEFSRQREALATHPDRQNEGTS